MDTLATHRHSSGLPGTSLQLGAWESKLIEGVNLSKAFDLLIHHSEGIPLILQAMKVPVPVQIIAKWNVARLTSTPAYAKDPFFAHVLPSTAGDSHPIKPKINKSDVSALFTNILRGVLELRPTEELGESYTRSMWVAIILNKYRYGGVFDIVRNRFHHVCSNQRPRSEGNRRQYPYDIPFRSFFHQRYDYQHPRELLE